MNFSHHKTKINGSPKGLKHAFKKAKEQLKIKDSMLVITLEEKKKRSLYKIMNHIIDRQKLDEIKYVVVIDNNEIINFFELK